MCSLAILSINRHPSDHESVFVAADQLKVLPGIGGIYSEKMIKGRPYQRKDELVRKKIILRSTCENINHKIVAKQKCNH